MNGNHRRPVVAGNWKLNKSVSEAAQTARDLKARLASARDCEVILAPVFTALSHVHEALQASGIGLAAQDVYPEDQGAFTGEVSAPLLKDVGCSYCIVGHSERRHLFGETDEMVKAKVSALLGHELTPILCVGETLKEREAGQTMPVVLAHISAATAELAPEEASRLLIAYEPVWAIGTGRTASPEDAQEVHAAIRNQLEKSHGPQVARGLRILYGGSVKPANAAELMSQTDIDGALVGGASLNAESFAAIVQAAY